MIAFETLRQYSSGYYANNSMGKIDKRILLKYLYAVKSYLDKLEPEIKANDREYRANVAKAKAEVSAWENSYAEKVLASLAEAVKSGDKSVVYVPNLMNSLSVNYFRDIGSQYELEVPDNIVVTPKSRPKLKKIIDSAPSVETVALATEDFSDWSPARRYKRVSDWLDPKTFTKWQEQLDKLIAHVEARSTPKIELAQLLDVQRRVEETFSGYKLTSSRKRPTPNL